MPRLVKNSSEEDFSNVQIDLVVCMVILGHAQMNKCLILIISFV